MANVFDSDVIIRRIRDLFGMTYENARLFFNDGKVTFSVPVTDAAISVSTSNNLAKPDSNQTIVVDSTTKTGTAYTAGTGISLYTVTAGKTLYVTSMSVVCAGAGAYVVTDNGVGGTPKLSGYIGATPQAGIVHTFPTPLTFTTDVFFDAEVNGTFRGSFAGWEQ